MIKDIDVATFWQQKISKLEVNGVIEVKRACICMKLKQIQLRATKDTPSSSNG